MQGCESKSRRERVGEQQEREKRNNWREAQERQNQFIKRKGRWAKAATIALSWRQGHCPCGQDDRGRNKDGSVDEKATPHSTFCRFDVSHNAQRRTHNSRSRCSFGLGGRESQPAWDWRGKSKGGASFIRCAGNKSRRCYNGHPLAAPCQKTTDEIGPPPPPAWINPGAKRF